MVMRGRALLGNDFHLRRRAASVPAEHLRRSDDVPDVDSRHRVHGIANRAAQDADDLTAASRRHDRDFLRDISSKLNGVSNGHGPTILVSKPPPPSSSGSIYLYPAVPVPQYKRVSTAPPSMDSRRRTWVAPSRAPPVDDYEVASYLAAAPCRPYVRSSLAMRSGSVPPVLPSRARWFPSAPVSHGEMNRVMGYRPSYRWNPSGDVANKAAMEDIVVGVAHTSLYGDIVIGIPYKKRFMFNVQHGLDELQDNGVPRIPVNLATRVTSSSGGVVRDGPEYNHFVNQVYRPLADYNPYASTNYGQSSLTVRPNVGARRASYSGPSYVSGRPHNYSTYYSDDANDSDYISTNYNHRQKVLPLTGKIYYDDYNDDNLSFKPHSYGGSSVNNISSGEPFSNLRTMTRVAQDKAKEHRTVLDKYLPNPVSSYPQVSTTAPSGLAMNSYSKPPISEARQKVRSLLCKSKKDPHYFE